MLSIFLVADNNLPIYIDGKKNACYARNEIRYANHHSVTLQNSSFSFTFYVDRLPPTFFSKTAELFMVAFIATMFQMNANPLHKKLRRCLREENLFLKCL